MDYNGGSAKKKKKKKSDVESESKRLVQKALTHLLKLWLNLYLFKWLNPSIHLVSNLIPDGLWTLYVGLRCDIIS